MNNAIKKSTLGNAFKISNIANTPVGISSFNLYEIQNAIKDLFSDILQEPYFIFLNPEEIEIPLKKVSYQF